jgi:hypothetical protein
MHREGDEFRSAHPAPLDIGSERGITVVISESYDALIRKTRFNPTQDRPAIRKTACPASLPEFSAARSTFL